jgi:hypothetical protein
LVAESASALVNVDEFLYLRCNATTWDLNASSRLKSTSDPYSFDLTLTVKDAWMVSGGDSCVLTKTNALDGWGSSNESYGTRFGVAVTVPGGAPLQSGSGSFQVKYPALGKYRATVNWRAGNIMINPLSAAEAWEPAPGAAEKLTTIGYGYGVGCGGIAPGAQRAAFVGYSNGDVYRSANGTAATPAWDRVDQWATSAGPRDLPNSPVLAIAVNPCNNRDVWVSFAGTKMGPKLFQTGVGGAAWSQVSNVGLAEVWGISFNPKALSRMYAVGAGGAVSYTKDGGMSWSPTQPSDDPLLAGLPADSQITAVTLAQNSADQLWVATRSGGIFVSTDGGVTFTARNLSTMPGRPVVGLSSSPRTWDFPKLYAGYSGLLSDSLWKTYNRYQPFVDIHNAALPTTTVDVPVLGLLNASENPIDANVLYTVATYGAGRSTDGGTTWTYVSP